MTQTITPKAQKKGVVSIRRSLTSNFILMIVLLSGIILLSMAVATRSAIKSLSDRIIAQTIDQAERRIGAYFDPVSIELLRMKTLGENGLLSIFRPEELKNQFKTTMQYYPQISAVMLARASGREKMLRRKSSGWLFREITPGLPARVTEYDSRRSGIISRPVPLDYDPCQRPWFINAHKKWETRNRHGKTAGPQSLISWTEPYRLYTANQTGTTISIPYKGPEDHLHVIGFDILFSDIQTFINELKILNNSQLMIITTEERPRIIVVSQAKKPDGSNPVKPFSFLDEADPRIPVIQYALSIRQQPGNFSGRAIHRFSDNGSAWWGAGKILDKEFEQGLFMCVVVPASDLLGNVENLWLWIMFITSGVLLIAFIRAMVLARRFSRPLEFLARSSQRISRGDFESGRRVRSNIYEIQELEKAHEHMRTGLKTLMKMENDIQIARDIQQKTFPAGIPKIKGYELAGWNSPVDETGGDTYDIIGYQWDGNSGEIQICENQADHALLLLSDATGHGIGPALSVTQLRAMLRMRVHLNPDMQLLIKHINTQLYADLPNGRFISAWFGKIDSDTDILSSFSAGQAPLLHYCAAQRQVAVLSSDTFPLGIEKELNHDRLNRIRMNPGDIFAVLSDGIFEAMDPAQALFGQDRVIEIIRQAPGDTPEALIRHIRLAVEAFAGPLPAGDDRTILIVKRSQPG